MKKRFLLLPLVLGTVAGGLYYRAERTGPSPADASTASQCVQAGRTHAQAEEAQPTPARTAVSTATADMPSVPLPMVPGRLARSALPQIIPSLRAPVADWRTFTPRQLTVVPVPGLPLEFDAQSITTDGKRTTWVGTNGQQGATLVACATETLWDAVITVPGADEYSIQITPDSVLVLETAHGNTNCGPSLSPAAAQLLASVATGSALPAGTAAAAPDTTTLNTSDLLVLYSTGAKNNWGSTAEMENRIAAVVATANTYLEQSQIANLRWRLVGTAEAPAYTTTEKLEDDLDRLANTTTELGRFAAERRTFYGADQVMLIVDGTRDYAGIAHLGTTTNPAAFSVVHHPGTAATAAHELAHNFGCRHDRQTESAPDGDGKYNYGHRFTYNSQDIGTIMSYAEYFVPYFSNPSVYYEGNPVGIAAGQPKAADNARWLRENAAGVSNLRASKTVAAPTITAQPTSVTVTAGQTLTLTVTATGNDLTYQWSHGGAEIAGATAATYRKTNCTDADAGSYTVLVSNLLGQVRSNAATVTVSPAPATPPPSTNNSSSGGGGGGAIEIVAALGLLALLGAGRRARG
jgi:hypothetical protein